LSSWLRWACCLLSACDMAHRPATTLRCTITRPTGAQTVNGRQSACVGRRRTRDGAACPQHLPGLRMNQDFSESLFRKQVDKSSCPREDDQVWTHCKA
jgi:hypothetical protein